MAAKPKLSPEQWALIRTTWEADPREGYAWLVEALGLNVSAPAVRKMAMRDGWTKCGPAVAAPAKGKVSQRNHGKVSQARRETITETIRETIRETMPETMEGADADAQSPDDGDAVLSNDEHESYQQLAPRVQRFVSEYFVDLNAAHTLT